MKEGKYGSGASANKTATFIDCSDNSIKEMRRMFFSVFIHIRSAIESLPYLIIFEQKMM